MYLAGVAKNVRFVAEIVGYIHSCARSLVCRFTYPAAICHKSPKTRRSRGILQCRRTWYAACSENWSAATTQPSTKEVRGKRPTKNQAELASVKTVRIVVCRDPSLILYVSPAHQLCVRNRDFQTRGGTGTRRLPGSGRVLL